MVWTGLVVAKVLVVGVGVGMCVGVGMKALLVLGLLLVLRIDRGQLGAADSAGRLT